MLTNFGRLRPSVSQLRTSGREAVSILKGLSRPASEPQRKFLIYGRGRSGSSLLVNHLNSHPDIVCDGELLNTRARIFAPLQYVRRHARMSNASIYGFKLLASQPSVGQQIADERAFVETLEASGFEVLHLYRRNLFRQVISRLVANHRGYFHRRTGDKPAKDDPILIEPDALQKEFDRRRGYVEIENTVLEGRKYFTICYEDDLEAQADRKRTIKRTLSHLGAAPMETSSSLIRFTPKRLVDIIANTDELRRHFTGTEIGEWLEKEITPGADVDPAE